MDTGQDTPELSTTEQKASNLILALVSAFAADFPDALSELSDQMGRKINVTFSAVPGVEDVTVNFHMGIKENQIGRER